MNLDSPTNQAIRAGDCCPCACDLIAGAYVAECLWCHDLGCWNCGCPKCPLPTQNVLPASRKLIEAQWKVGA